MEPTGVFSTAEFSFLTGRNDNDINADISLGNLIYWNQNTGSGFGRKFITIDAILYVLFQLFCQQFKIKFIALRVALPGMQLRLPAGVDRRDTEMMIAIKPMKNQLKVVVDCGTLDELNEFDIRKYRAHWRLPVALATSIVKARAKEHGIALPTTFAPDQPPFRMRGSLPLKYRTPDGKVTSEWTPAANSMQLPKGIVN